jgi:hypothetical protein
LYISIDEPTATYKTYGASAFIFFSIFEAFGFSSIDFLVFYAKLVFLAILIFVETACLNCSSVSGLSSGKDYALLIF